MALVDRVIDRIPDDRLVSLTNPKDSNATVLNAAILALAAADAEAEFRVETATDYDNDDPRHVVAAVRGVIFYLHEWKGMLSTQAGQESERRYRDTLRAVAQVTGRDYVPFLTSSEQTPSREAPAGEIVRPFNDDEAWEDLELRAPDGTG